MMMDFEILINDIFSTQNEDDQKNIENNKLLSLINDFESGEWRHGKFQNYIWNNIAETALSSKERDKLIDKYHTVLSRSAKNLRITSTDDPGSGGELCEILLYGIMKDHHGAIPVVPKIFYKQNSQDNAKGADSVHIVLEDNNDFSLWFGEAKFYTNINKAIDSAVKSVYSFFENSQVRKENQIIVQSISEYESAGLDKKLIKKITESLDAKNSLDNIKSKINIPILLLYECNITKNSDFISPEYKQSIINAHKDHAKKYFEKQNISLAAIPMFSKIKFHLILFPVPDRKLILCRFNEQAESYRKN